MSLGQKPSLSRNSSARPPQKRHGRRRQIVIDWTVCSIGLTKRGSAPCRMPDTQLQTALGRFRSSAGGSEATLLWVLLLSWTGC